MLSFISIPLYTQDNRPLSASDQNIDIVKRNLKKNQKGKPNTIRRYTPRNQKIQVAFQVRNGSNAWIVRDGHIPNAFLELVYFLSVLSFLFS